MFACDFDGTFADWQEKISLRNRQSAAMFRQCGGLFGVCSGRDVISLKQALRDAGLAYDFLVCLNGAYIEVNGLCLQKKALSINLEPIQKLLLDEGCISYMLFGEQEISFRERAPLSNLTEHQVFVEDIKKVLGHYRWRESGQEFEHNILQISCQMPNSKGAEVLAKLINSRYLGCRAYANCESIDIISDEINKAVALKYLQQYFSISKQNVYVIGDGCNDLPMVEHFNGFCMENAHPLLKESASRSFAHVSDALIYVKEFIV